MDKYVPEENRPDGIDLKRLTLILARNYVWFILAVSIALVGAYIYLRYTVPLFPVTGYVQIQTGNGDANVLGGTPFAAKTNSAATNFTDVNSEMFKLQSAALIGEVVDSLDLTLSVTKTVGVKKTPVLTDSLPFKLTVHKGWAGKSNSTFDLTLHPAAYRLTTAAGTVNGSYGRPLAWGENTVMVTLKRPIPVNRKISYRVNVMDRSAAVSRYAGRLSVSPVPKGGLGMLQLSMRDEIPLRAKQFIEVLIYRYDLGNILYKSKSLRSELDFLDNRLATVNSELEKQENTVRDFKAGNKINDLSTSANQLLTNLSSIDTKKSDNEYKESLVNLVEKSVNANNGKEERINVNGLQDPDLVTLVGKYNELVSQKNNILAQSTPNDLRLESINTSLSETRSGILNRIKSIRVELKTSNEFLRGQEQNTAGRFMRLPEKEKDYIQVSRLLNIKQSLFVFLLQRKEDLNIEFASSGMAGTRIVDWRMNDHTQQPKPFTIYLAALAIGLALPTGIVTTRFLLNKRIETYQEIYKATSLPVAGEIALNRKSRGNTLVMENDGSPVAEQFRTLRTNIFYFNKGTGRKTVLITSAASGEGKSFVSLNLAGTIAISGKKTILVDFDLRNPALSEKLAGEEMPGITNFLEGKAGTEQIIIPLPGYAKLWFISAGCPLAEQPGEIILSSRMKDLFDHLRSNFDYIILDTPPIETVSDALTLSPWSDTSLFVIRHKYSLRSSLTLFNQLHADKKLPHPSLVINGIVPGDGFNNVYGYGYGYGSIGARKRKPGDKLKIA